MESKTVNVEELLDTIAWASAMLTDNDAKSLLKPECQALIQYVTEQRAQKKLLRNALRNTKRALVKRAILHESHPLIGTLDAALAATVP